MTVYESTTILTPTAFPCWKCGRPLYHLAPPVYGWSYHCPRCQHLTSPQADLEAALAAIGIVSAVPCRIDVQEGGAA